MIVRCQCGAETDFPLATSDTTYTCKDCSQIEKTQQEQLWPPQHNKGRQWGKKKVREFLSKNLFERKVEKELREGGCQVFRNGWPDYLAIKEGRPVFIEVKHGTDQLQPAQITMIKALRSIGIKVQVLSLNEPTWRQTLRAWIGL